MWSVVLVDEAEEWFLGLDADDAGKVTAAIDTLETAGPGLGRPLVDSVKGSRFHHMKELRRGSVRVLFAFDPEQNAVVLVGGDKRGEWAAWYQENIPVADQRYQKWLDGGYASENH